MRYQALSVAEHLPPRLRNGRDARPAPQPVKLPDVQWSPPSFDDSSVLGTKKSPAITLPPVRYLENADAPRVFLHPGNKPHVVYPESYIPETTSSKYPPDIMQDKYFYLPRSASYTAEPTLPPIYFFHKKEAGVSLHQVFFGDGRHFIDQSMKRAFVDVKAPFPLLRIQIDWPTHNIPVYKMSSGNPEGTHSVTQGFLVRSIAQQIHHTLLTLRNSSTNLSVQVSPGSQVYCDLSKVPTMDIVLVGLNHYGTPGTENSVWVPILALPHEAAKASLFSLKASLSSL